MNGNTTKIIAVGIVVIVAAAGLGTFFVLKDKDKGDGVNIDAALEVYGNADGDYKIDSKDVDVIKKIINNEEGYNLEKYPLADAYKDGVVDDKDVEQVEKIIAGGPSDGTQMTVWHINHNTDTTKYPDGQYVVDTKWPVTKAIANGAANAMVVYKMVGLDENIVGINYSTSSPPDSVVYPNFAAMESLGSSTTSLTESKVTACVANNPGTTAVLTADNKSYLASGTNEAYIEGTLKMDVIRIQHAAVDPNEYSSALLLLGFLFKKDTNAVEAADWITNVYKSLDDKIKDVEKKVRVAASSGECYLSARNSDYADVTVQAGGDYTMWVSTSSSIYFKDYQGTRFYPADPNVLRPENQPDKIIWIRTQAYLGTGASWYGSESNWNVAKMKEKLTDFNVFQCYGDKDVYVISGDMPVVARVLYSASILYPDLVSKDFADDMHQEFVEKFLGNAYKVSEHRFMLSQSDIENMTSSSA